MKTTEKAIRAWLMLPKYALDDYEMRAAEPGEECFVLMGPDAMEQIADDLRELARLKRGLEEGAGRGGGGMKDRSTQKPVTAEPFALLVAQELGRARAGHAPLNSAHEGYAVILEELDEFWEWCRMKREHRIPTHGLAELVQVAAMAQRLAEDLGFCAPAESSSEGCSLVCGEHLARAELQGMVDRLGSAVVEKAPVFASYVPCAACGEVPPATIPAEGWIRHRCETSDFDAPARRWNSHQEECQRVRTQCIIADDPREPGDTAARAEEVEELRKGLVKRLGE